MRRGETEHEGSRWRAGRRPTQRFRGSPAVENLPRASRAIAFLRTPFTAGGSATPFGGWERLGQVLHEDPTAVSAVNGTCPASI
jgi:hypothetical protein